MTRLLETPVFSTQNSLPHEAKFVDEHTQGKSFQALAMAAAPRLGSGHFRKGYLDEFANGGSVGGFVENAYEEWERRRDAEWGCLSPEERLGAELAELEAEENEDGPDVLHRVRDTLPTAFLPFLNQFGEVRRRQRLQDILTTIGWKTLRLLDLDPPLVEAEAEKAAWLYAQKHPENDPRYQKPEHRRGRMPKHWKAKLKKQVRQARPYIAMAVGAVGGKGHMRPLYVSDHGVSCRRAELRHSRKMLEKLRIVNVNDPLTQIPMLEANERKKVREMAKRRLLLDIMQYRAETIGAKAVWITITLPGSYHPNPTNSTPDTNDWNWRLGPKQAMQAIQDRYHQTMCMLRERGIRAWGFWDAQAQQDGTPHRHIVIFIHDEDEAAALLEARAVAMAFRNRFPGTHGCDASVIGDDHPCFKPRKDKHKKEETVASIIRYTARYSTKMAMGADGAELAGEVPDDDTPATELERHAVWASERDARLHTVIGMDSQRAPSRVWDCIWKAAERGECPADERMGAAVQWMRWTQEFLNELIARQNELADLKRSGREDLTYEAALSEDIQNLQIGVSENAYHAALLCGLWADADIHPTERAWLREELGVKVGDDLPMPPVPLRAERENAFGETVKETIGIASPIEIQEETDDSLLLRLPNGTTKLVRPSDDETRQIILKIEEWVIVDADKAKEMSEEALQIRAEQKAKWDKKQEEERASWLALQKSEMAQSPENKIDEVKAPFDFIEENKRLSDIAIYPSLSADALDLGALPPSDPPPL